ncbi:hypothetical protein [Pectobacterium carotovorum]|uniref:hypothetical protein n=1 Tax=Pectobacterium carotovorum TaxID=554 RepID=UPI0021F3C6E6|nr:hypothetical protein [Pectobacterium carotovorum]
MAANQAEGAYLEGGKGLTTVDMIPTGESSAGETGARTGVSHCARMNFIQPSGDRFLSSL